ncbi:MAG TPA: beta-ketoacyl-ACP synthase III [Polyangia bacterium]|jgi:3-oxoacyl-[acyl-carrier-protein] synthase-3
MGIRVSGIGGYVPARTMTNLELAMMVDTSHEWIISKTGIRERRLAGPEEAPSDLGCQAALRCLAHAGVDKNAVDLVIVACASPDHMQPAVACLVQEKLGIAATHCPAFDVNSVCAGFVFALNVAQGMMLTEPTRYRNVLVIGTDTFSKILNWKDRRTCVFFGDGAGAVLLSQTDGERRRFHFHLGSDGRGREFIAVPGGGTRMPASPEVLEKQLNKFVMNGPRVWEFAVNTVPETIRTLLAEHDLRPADLDLLILHQSNLRMLEAIMKSLELPMAKTITTVEDYGNTAAASIPLTLQKASETGRLRPGSRVMLCGFGGGLSWGAALIDW